MTRLRLQVALALSLGLSLTLVLPAQADPLEREDRYESFAKDVLEPWFDSSSDEWTDGKASERGPVKLRFRAFTSPKNRGNVLVLHGFGERIEKHQEMAYDFFTKGYNVFAFDARGFGLSTRINPKGKAVYVDKFEDYVEDLVAFIKNVIQKRTPGQRTVIFAHSMSSLIAILTIEKGPELVAGLIVSAPMLAVNTGAVPAWAGPLLARGIRRLGFGNRYALTQTPEKIPKLATAHTQSANRFAVYARYIRKPENWQTTSGGASYAWVDESFKAMRAAATSGFATNIEVPILLFVAGADSSVLPEAQERFCRSAATCERVVIAGAKHEIYREADAYRVPYMQKIFSFLQSMLQ